MIAVFGREKRGEKADEKGGGWTGGWADESRVISKVTLRVK